VRQSICQRRHYIQYPSEAATEGMIARGCLQPIAVGIQICGKASIQENTLQITFGRLKTQRPLHWIRLQKSFSSLSEQLIVKTLKTHFFQKTDLSSLFEKLTLSFFAASQILSVFEVRKYS